MERYTYIPNEFAKKAFNLEASSYSGRDMGKTVRDAIGTDNYKNILAGDFRQGESTMDVYLQDLRCIGQLTKG